MDVLGSLENAGIDWLVFRWEDWRKITMLTMLMLRPLLGMKMMTRQSTLDCSGFSICFLCQMSAQFCRYMLPLVIKVSEVGSRLLEFDVNTKTSSTKLQSVH